LTRKGEYQQGKLVSGDPVVPDIMYKNPEIKAEYSKAKSDLNDQLRAKFDTLKKPEGIYVQAAKLNLVIDKSGKVIQVQKTPGCEPVFFAVSNALLKDLSGFTPGKVENVPVDSELIMEFQLSPQRFAVVTDEPPLSLSQESEANSENPQKVYTIVEQVPEYPGGLLGLRKFIAMNVRYPVEALEKGMVGKVFVSFVIDETGEVTNIKLARGVHPSLDQEAIRVVKLMDRWKPGIKDGKSVKVSYTVPINFDIQISEPR
jgi:TonB family protein